jgi:hypothetical protein
MKTRTVFVFFLLLLLATASFGQTAASGYAVTTIVTGFASQSYGVGPTGMALDTAGNLYVSECYCVGASPTQGIYKFGPGGGVASAATELATASSLGGVPWGLAFGKDGKLYAALVDAGKVVQVDTVSGAVVRTVATGIFVASELATDPLSGDLFVDQSGAANNIYRVSPTSGTVTLYATVPNATGLAFAPDGTLYAASLSSQEVVKISGTNSPPPTPSTWTVIASVPLISGIAVSATPGTPFLYANRSFDGSITKVDLTTSPATLTDVVTGGTYGVNLAVGPDGSLYATQSNTIIRITNADGTSLSPPLGPLFPSNPPAINVSGVFFVIGNLNAVPGNTVNFWGAQWASLNSLSGGIAPNAFKGFAGTGTQSCGGTWTSQPGDSSNPPATVPPFMAVIASSSVTKSGSVITGDVSNIVIVSTNPGYGPAPGHAGTGTVVAVLCSR